MATVFTISNSALFPVVTNVNSNDNANDSVNLFANIDPSSSDESESDDATGCFAKEFRRKMKRNPKNRSSDIVVQGESTKRNKASEDSKILNEMQGNVMIVSAENKKDLASATETKSESKMAMPYENLTPQIPGRYLEHRASR